MYITEIINMFHKDGVDDFEIKKTGDTIIFGYFKDYPVDLIIIKNCYVTEIIPSRNDKTEWMYQLIEKRELIIDDYDCANCSHGLDIESNINYECEIDGTTHCCDEYCNNFIG